MQWSDLLDPFGFLANTAGSIVADGWTAAMLAFWNAGLWLLRLVLTLEDFFLTPDLTAAGPMGGVYRFTFWIAGAFALVLLMVQLGFAAIRRDGASLARIVLGVGQFVMVWVAWIVYAVAVLAAAAGLSKALMRALLEVEVLAAWQPWSGFSTADITDGTVATVLGVLGVFLIFAAFTHLLVMLARAAALVVLAATNPIAAAGLMWEGGRAWFWKAFRWFHAAAFTPVIMVLVLGLGVQVTNNVALSMADSLQSAIGTAVPGVFLILIGSFAPLALFKLLAFVDPGTSSGAAMRTGLAAQGGLSGLLQRGTSSSSGAGASESGAAAQASPDGATSQGEATAEAATSQRMAGTASGIAGMLGPVGAALGTGLGVVVGAGTAAATIGADLTNQMGVGHNTYIPDFTTTRRNNNNGSGGGTGGAAHHHQPDVNGAGEQNETTPDQSGDQGGAGGPWPQVPVPTAPSVGPSTGGAGPAAAGADGGGAAGAGGAGAAGGGAAAVPPV